MFRIPSKDSRALDDDTNTQFWLQLQLLKEILPTFSTALSSETKTDYRTLGLGALAACEAQLRRTNALTIRDEREQIEDGARIRTNAKQKHEKEVDQLALTRIRKTSQFLHELLMHLESLVQIDIVERNLHLHPIQYPALHKLKQLSSSSSENRLSTYIDFCPADELPNKILKLIMHANLAIVGVSQILPVLNQSFHSKTAHDESFVEHCHPAASKSLTDQLAFSNHMRRKRLLHEQRRRNKNYDASMDEDKAKDGRKYTITKSRPRFVLRTVPPIGNTLREEDPQSPTTLSNQESMQPQTPRAEMSGHKMGSSVVTGSSAEYPAQPCFEKNQPWLPCPYCSRSLETAELGQQPEYWRNHVKEDLQPYVCLAEKCRDPPKFFTQLEDWADHMDFFHGPDWPLTVHMTTWYCEYRHAKESFQSSEDLEDHLGAVHKDFTGFQIDALLARNKTHSIRKPFTCPLCEIVVEHNTQGVAETDQRASFIRHISGHLLSLSLYSLPLPLTKSADADRKLQSESFRIHQTSENSPLNISELTTDLTFPLPNLPEASTKLERDCVDPGGISLTSEKEVHVIPADNHPSPIYLLNGQPYKLNTFGAPVHLRLEFDDMNLDRVHRGEDYYDLRQLLRKCQVTHLDKIHTFWPDQFLRRILSRKRVEGELQSFVLDKVTQQNLWGYGIQWYLEKLFPADSMDPDTENGAENGIEAIEPPKEPIGKRYIKLYAVLILCEQQPFIRAFIEAGISDMDLPLIPCGLARFGLALRSNPTRCISCFKNWKAAEIEQFFDFQYAFLIPYFCLASDPNSPIKHAKYYDRTIMPWIKEDAGKREHGGYAEVSCMRIHPACHGFQNLAQVKSSNGLFALKRMTSDNPNDFGNETKMLRMFSGHHDHIIMHLMSFSHKGRDCLLFPWADCDLDIYWSDYSNKSPYDATTKIMDIDLMKWVSKQILGLTSGLHQIHNPTHLHDRSDMRYGRHGDIKPENILWFKSEKDPHGILVITDLGISAVHRTISRSNEPNKDVPHSRDYRPPECDQEGGTISRAFDIWTLGCLLLDMVCWALGGVELIREFAHKRSKISYIGMNSQIYFDVKVTDKGETVILVKDVVPEFISVLHEHPGCTNYFHDLLDIIQDDMIILQSRDKARIRSGPLYKKISGLHDRVSIEGYGLYPCPAPKAYNTPVAIKTQLNKYAEARLESTKAQLGVYHGIVVAVELNNDLAIIDDAEQININILGESTDSSSQAINIEEIVHVPSTASTSASGKRADHSGAGKSSQQKPPIEIPWSITHKNGKAGLGKGGQGSNSQGGTSSRNDIGSNTVQTFNDHQTSTNFIKYPSIPSGEDLHLEFATSSENQDRDLIHKLRAARLVSTDNDACYFVPVDELDKLITQSSILKELEMRKVGVQKDRVSITKQVWEIQLPTRVTTRRKIFATLALMEKLEAILDFLNEDVDDSMLPFVLDSSGSVISEITKEAILLFLDSSKWRSSEKEIFEKYQWEMMAPYFRLGYERASSFNCITVDDRAVLPFSQIQNSRESGSSIVRQVKIHPAHYNARDFSTTSGDNPCFAVKTLTTNSEATVLDNQEVQSLIRLNKENNIHLVQLLAAFQHRKQLHLVFPWADGNLHDLWKTQYPDPSNPIRDYNLAKWVAEQCLGLALALKTIHHSSAHYSQAGLVGSQLDDPIKRFGRHGDLKPENVLWFRQDSSDSSNRLTGILKVSDFGLADFQSLESELRVPVSKISGSTPTYRAPEIDVGEIVGPSYDLWSFGCVLLEFIAWYLSGWQGIEEFELKRIKDSVNERGGYCEDNFFNWIVLEEQDKRMAMAKASVRLEIQGLRCHEMSSDFTLDLLNYLEDHLIRMNPENRHDAHDLVKRLEEIRDRCMQDPGYSAEKTGTIRPRSNSELSEIIQFLSPLLRHRNTRSRKTRQGTGKRSIQQGAVIKNVKRSSRYASLRLFK